MNESIKARQNIVKLYLEKSKEENLSIIEKQDFHCQLETIILNENQFNTDLEKKDLAFFYNLRGEIRSGKHPNITE